MKNNLSRQIVALVLALVLMLQVCGISEEQEILSEQIEATKGELNELELGLFDDGLIAPAEDNPLPVIVPENDGADVGLAGDEEEAGGNTPDDVAVEVKEFPVTQETEEGKDENLFDDADATKENGPQPIEVVPVNDVSDKAEDRSDEEHSDTASNEVIEVPDVVDEAVESINEEIVSSETEDQNGEEQLQEPEVVEQEIELADSETVEVPKSSDIQDEPLYAAQQNNYEPRDLYYTISKNCRLTVNSGDHLRVTLPGLADSAYSTKAIIADFDGFGDNENTVWVITGKPGKATITFVLRNGKKIKAKITVVDPYLATNVNFVNPPTTLLVGEKVNLMRYIQFNPAYARNGLSWKSSKKRVVRVDKNGNITALKAGRAKITVKTKNKKKRVLPITVKANRIDKLSSKPNKRDIAALGNTFTIRPKSISIPKNGSLLCEFYLLNGTKKKITSLSGLNLKVKLGNDKKVVAGGGFGTFRVNGKKKGTSTFKVAFIGQSLYQSNLRLINWGANQVFFEVNSSTLKANAGGQQIGYNNSKTSIASSTTAPAVTQPKVIELSGYYGKNIAAAAKAIGGNFAITHENGEDNIDVVYSNYYVTLLANGSTIQEIRLNALGNNSLLGIQVGSSKAKAQSILNKYALMVSGADSAEYIIKGTRDNWSILLDVEYSGNVVKSVAYGIWS